jgi:hypothetical protein
MHTRMPACDAAAPKSCMPWTCKHAASISKSIMMIHINLITIIVVID